MRIVYMGTPEFAVKPLQALINAKHTICGVFTQPDKPVGRKQILTPPAVKTCAESNGIPVFQPNSVKNGTALNILKDLKPQLIVVVAYGKILPADILSFPEYGCINVHASLLPKLRGAAPIQWSIINGEKTTGVTTMFMDVGLDTGDMLLKSETQIQPDETAEQLHDRLADMGAKLILETISKLECNKLTRIKQDDALSSYAPMLNKEIAEIDWSKTAQEIHNKVRGLYPWPVAISKIEGKRVKIHKTRLSTANGECGKILSLSPFVVGTALGAIEILEIQAEGKKKMTAEDYLRGNRLLVGEKFGND